MPHRTPLVSVIIPTYNRKTFLEEVIKSVYNQSNANIEIIVVDDGSEINYGEEICEKYENCFYHWKPNGGLSSTRNYGITKAKGDYIAFLDDDDLWKPGKVEKQLEIFKKHADVDLVHSSAEVIDENGKPTGKFIGATKNKAHKRSGYVFWNALGTWVVKSPTPLIKKSVFDDNLVFDETIKVGEDVDFYQRLFYKHKVYYIDEALAQYRVYNDSKRLSLQRNKYIGIELKLFNNLMKMKITNPIVKYRIAMTLYKSAFSKFRLRNNNETYAVNIFYRILFPYKSLIKLVNYEKGL